MTELRDRMMADMKLHGLAKGPRSASGCASAFSGLSTINPLHSTGWRAATSTVLPREK